MRELLKRIGDPQKRLPAVHIAGTKGKGSTAAMTAAILSAAKYRTGLFTSPHLEHIEERVVIDGRSCSEDEFVEAISEIRPAVEAMDQVAAEKNPQEYGPTYFEIITAAAWYLFSHRWVDLAILEVGLGGRLDSTNVCHPSVTVITSISFDHDKQLGDTLEKIAAEKAGIIKPGVPVISGVTSDPAREVIRHVARENGCKLLELGVDFTVDYRPPANVEDAPSRGSLEFCYEDRICRNIELGLLGRHQAANAALALAAVEELRRQGWDIPESAVRQGLSEVTWPARVEVVSRRPTVILDAAHNAASIQSLVDALAESFHARRRWLIFATTQDKDLDGMLECLAGRFDEVIFSRYLHNPRSVPPEQLLGASLEVPQPFASRVSLASTPAEAWDAVRRNASPDDLICVTGSFFFAVEMRREWADRPFPA
jgi:dihydrofolate synthase/folylpolyglutamate synthase